jgi:hypothetical protein
MCNTVKLKPGLAEIFSRTSKDIKVEISRRQASNQRQAQFVAATTSSFKKSRLRILVYSSLEVLSN